MIGLQRYLEEHGVRYFTAREVLARNPNRDWEGPLVQPPDLDTVPGILRVALFADRVRDILGSPIRVVSWYRSPAYNAHVGGARASRHLLGDAIDLAPVTASLADLDRIVLRELAWYDERGIPTGYRRYGTFIHVDIGGRARRWRG